MTWEEKEHDFFKEETEKLVAEIPASELQEFREHLEANAKDIDAVIYDLFKAYCMVQNRTRKRHGLILDRFKAIDTDDLEEVSE